jgi:hypothetical protein
VSILKRVFGGSRYANVTATLALVAALGGTAYAATALPANSVGTKQLKEEAVTSKKVKKESLKANDFAPGQIPPGPEGKQGPTGKEGPAGKEGPQGKEGAAGEPGLIRSYAHVKANGPNENSPIFTGPHPGFVSVSRGEELNEGEIQIYCLAPEAGIEMNEFPAFASLDLEHSTGATSPLIGASSPPASGASGCETGDVAVFVRDGDERAKGISFDVAVP